MAIVSIQGRWFEASGQGSTVEVNMPPGQVYSQAWLYKVTGGGLHKTGIKAFRRRLPDGSDQVVDFGTWPSWPPSVTDRVSSITFGISVGDGQSAEAMLRIDHLG